MVALPGGSGGARTPTDAFRMRARAAAERQRSHVRPSARRSSLHPRAARDHRCSGSRVGTRLAPRSARGGTQGWKNSTTYRVHRAQPGGSTARQARGGTRYRNRWRPPGTCPEFVISSTPRGRIVSADAGARRRERMRRPRESRKTCEASSAAGESRELHLAAGPSGHPKPGETRAVRPGGSSAPAPGSGWVSAASEAEKRVDNGSEAGLRRTASFRGSRQLLDRGLPGGR